MEYMKKICLLLLLGLLLPGCALQPAQPGIFDNPTCEPPCWNGITPGVTTKKEALVILSKTKGLDQPTVDLNHSDLVGFDDEIQFTLYKDNDGSAGWIYILDNQVSIIGFANGLNINLQHAIEAFGTPQSILVIHTGRFDQIMLVNPQVGIAFGYKLFGAQDLTSSNIGPETEINDVTFFDPKQYERVLNSGILSAYTLSADETKTNLHPWNGYGSFKDKYWPPVTP